MNVRVVRRGVWNAVGVLFFVVTVFPVFWMISTAFKPTDQVNSLTPTWGPTHPTLRHFSDALHTPYFWADVKNSLIVVLVAIAIATALSFLAAVAPAKYRFTGRKLFIVLVIGIQMLPGAGLVIPLYVLLARCHQVDTLTGVIVVYLTSALPFSVWTLRGFILGIPKDLLPARPAPDRLRPHGRCGARVEPDRPWARIGIDHIGKMCLDRGERRATLDLTLHPHGPAVEHSAAGPRVARAGCE